VHDEVATPEVPFAAISIKVFPAVCVMEPEMPKRFFTSQRGVELRLDIGDFLIAENASTQKELEKSCGGRKSEQGKEQLKFARELRFMQTLMALHQCSQPLLDEIIDEAFQFTQQGMLTLWKDPAANYFMQHLMKIVKAEQLEVFSKFLLDNFDTLLKDKTAFAGRYIERLTERDDFLNLLNTTTYFRELVDRIGEDAPRWAKHRDGNFALGKLLETAPMWFVYSAQGHLNAYASKTGDGVVAQVRICLEKAKSRECQLREAAMKFNAVRLHSTLRRSRSTSGLGM
jgi:hypothetical protein